MNTNRLIIGSIIVLIIFALVGIFVVLKSGPSAPSNTKTIQSSQGPLEVQDYTQNPVQTTNDVLVLSEDADFQLVNFKADNSFLITLQTTPLNAARQKAEAEFLKILNISQEQACTLSISVKVPLKVDETYSGHELGLSFCPNSVALP